MSNALLAGALAALGFHKMSGKALAAPEDDPQALANVVASEMGAEVEAQVQAQEAKHPMLTALAAAEIKTPEALAAVLADAKLGREAMTDLRTKACQNAIIAYGPEEGKAEAETVAALSGASLSRYAARVEKDAQAKVGTGKPQTLGTQTAGVRYAQNAEGDAPDPDAVDDKLAAKMLDATADGRTAAKAKA